MNAEQTHELDPNSYLGKYGPECVCGGFWESVEGKCLRQIDQEARSEVKVEVAPETFDAVNLRRVWKAMGCASNPDDFKPEVRAAMWDQVVAMAERDTARNNTLYRENEALQVELDRLRTENEEQGRAIKAALSIRDRHEVVPIEDTATRHAYIKGYKTAVHEFRAALTGEATDTPPVTNEGESR